MTRFDLIAYTGVMHEHRVESPRAYRRRIRRQMRFVDPPYETLKALIETLFWMAVACLVVACVISFMVMFVRWWMCA